MSIFKDTFRKYVRDQISLREEIISIGNPKDTDALTGDVISQKNRLSSQHNIELQSGTVVKELDAGAYYNYTLNKQCILRLTSMVDYVENVNLEIGGLEGENSFNALKGAALSQNFILEGGVLSDFARVKDGNKITRRVTTPRDSFPRPGQKTNLGYGDLAIGADATSDGYGIVPMPGIIDANIRTKSAYGSLREAKINFECHNRRQLEILEMLYMRPGYMVVLEWGWTPYINNRGEVYKGKRLLEDFFADKDGKNSRIYTNNLTQEEVFSGINKLKEFHNGNYDGFLGFVKNFGFQAREDGGFSCYTELISIGEVIDSLKMPSLSTVNGNTPSIFANNGSTNDGDSNVTISSKTGVGRGGDDIIQRVDQITFNNALEAGIFPQYNGLEGLIRSLSNYAHFNSFSSEGGSSITTLDYEEQALSEIFDFRNEEITNAASEDEKDFYEEQAKIARQQSLDAGYGGGSNVKNFLRDLVKFQSANLENYLIKVLQIQNKEELRNYIIPVGGRKEKADGGLEYKNPQPFIRWDAFCTLINENLITKDEKGKHPVHIISDRLYDTDDPIEGITKLDPLLHVPIGDYTNTQNNTIIDFSCDANVCILPVQFETNPLESQGGEIDTLGIEDSLGYIPKTDVFPLNYIIGTYDKDKPVYYKGVEISPETPLKLTTTDRSRRIGNIFLNINMLTNLAEKNNDNADYTVGKFLNDIWGEVNKVCPNHNFVITDDKEGNTIFVIDLPVDNSEVPLDLHEFIPFSNKNILRKFEYTSNVPSAMSSTIAIQSQDPRSIQDIDGVTFAAFNRSIKNRLLSTDITSNWEKTKNDVTSNASQYQSKQNELGIEINRYFSSFFRNLKLTANDKETLGEGNITGILKEYQKNATYLSLAYSKTSVFNSVIPLEFSAELDGIAGVVIGNMFKVRKDRLPKAYSNANIGFIVFGEEQKITAGQDWTTDISGKMTILPEEGKKPIITGVTTSTFTDEEILKQKSQISAGSNTNEYPEGQADVTDISQATDNDLVYLKKIKDNTIESKDGNAFRGNIGVTFLRSSPEINNESFTDWGDNVIGAFDSWQNGGMVLGVVKPEGVRPIPFENGYIAILPSAYNTYFNETPSKTPVFKPVKIDSSTTTFIKKDGQEIECYVVKKNLNLGKPGGIDTIKSKDFRTGEFIDPKAPDQTRYIKKSDCTTTKTVWYNIAFTKEASDLFLNGWVRDRNNIRTSGANDQLKSGTTLQEFSAGNAECWMRFDTLAATAESAIQAFIENDEPEVINNLPEPFLIENYEGFDIYEIETPGGFQYYTIPTLIEDGEVILSEDDTTYSVDDVKDEIDRILATFDTEIPDPE